MRVYRLFINNLILIGILFCSGFVSGAEKVRLDFEHFYDCDELEATLKSSSISTVVVSSASCPARNPTA